MSAAASEAVQRLTGEQPTDTRPLGGAAFAVTMGSGQRLVAKRGEGENAAPAEAAGLRWLAEYDDVPIPRVLGSDADWLITEHLSSGSPTESAAEAFGAGLARLHLRGADAFGSPPPGGPTDAWIGLAPMRNEPEPDWPTFYARHRVLPYVRRAVDQGQFDREEAAVFERVCDRIPKLAGHAEPPARLHGDAWSGNVHWGNDGPASGAQRLNGGRWSGDTRAALLDPAAHGGHRETDLAMLQLFGLPMLDRVLGAYSEAAEQAGAPLADGWRNRVGLHQLFPLLVHTVLFGGGYRAQALAAARTAG